MCRTYQVKGASSPQSRRIHGILGDDFTFLYISNSSRDFTVFDIASLIYSTKVLLSIFPDYNLVTNRPNIVACISEFYGVTGAASLSMVVTGENPRARKTVFLDNTAPDAPLFIHH